MDNGRIYAGSIDMEHTGADRLQGGINKPDNNTLGYNHTFIYYFVANLFTAGYYGLQMGFKTVKNNMAALAFKSIFLAIFGVPISLYFVVLSITPQWLADININELPAPARYIFMVLAAAYLFYIIMNARENYRKKRIDNDEQVKVNRKKHLKDRV